MGTYTITASAGANGTITPSGAIGVAWGGNQSFAIAANAGYVIQDVLVDAVSVGAVASGARFSVAQSIVAFMSARAMPRRRRSGRRGVLRPCRRE